MKHKERPATCQVWFEDPATRLARLPNGDRLHHNPQDDVVYQVDPATNRVLFAFCSLNLWRSTYSSMLSKLVPVMQTF